MNWKYIILLFLLGCGGNETDDHSKDAWLPIRPTVWTLTPGGATRQGGEIGSVKAGWETEDEIDAAVDLGFTKFWTTFPEFAGLRASVAFVDDYVMWIGQWAAGWNPTGEALIFVALWSKGISATEPLPCWKCYAPGEAYNTTTNWHFTTKPLCPAVIHELLHVAIGDPYHLDSRWKLVK